MIDDYPISDSESPTARTRSNDLACQLMPRDYALIAFRTFPQVLMIDCADIRTANRRGLYGEKNFAMARLRDRNFFHLDSAVPRKERCFHHLAHRIHSQLFSCTDTLREERVRPKK